MRVAALSGGVGGGRLLAGLSRVVASADLTAIVNTADDDRIRGLHVSPDVDSVLYHLAGECDWERGWGLRDETFASNEQFARLAAAADEPGVDLQEWFGLGDRDLATHQLRTRLLDAGLPMSRATAAVARALGVRCSVLPMTDEAVRTKVVTRQGETLGFEEYFVRRRHEDDVAAIRFDGAASARPAPGALEALDAAEVIAVTPSNPLVSIGPILAVAGFRETVARASAVRFGVSPIVGGRAVKGPAARLLADLGHEPTALGVARMYAGLLDVWIIDRADVVLAPDIDSLGMRSVALDTIMRSAEDSARLAKEVLEAL